MPEQEKNACSLETASLREADLRRFPRHLCLDAGTLRLAVRPEFRGRRALLVDLSAGGIGFLLENPLEAGTVIVLDLQGPEGTNAVGRTARVRHGRVHPVPANAPWLPQTPAFSRLFRSLFGLQKPEASSQAWFIGCEFDHPLSEADIDQVIASLKSTPE